MFSTIDGWGTRSQHVFAFLPGIRRELEIPSTLQGVTRRVRAFPSEANQRVLATAQANELTPDVGRLETIEIQVWSTNYDAVTVASTNFLLRALRLAGDAF